MGQPETPGCLHLSDTDRPGGCHDDQEPDQGFDTLDQQAHEGGGRTARDRADLDLYGPALVRHGVEACRGEHRIYLRIAGAQRPQNHGELPGQLRTRGTGKECRNINEILILLWCHLILIRWYYMILSRNVPIIFLGVYVFVLSIKDMQKHFHR